MTNKMFPVTAPAPFRETGPLYPRWGGRTYGTGVIISDYHPCSPCRALTDCDSPVLEPMSNRRVFRHLTENRSHNSTELFSWAMWTRLWVFEETTARHDCWARYNRHHVQASEPADAHRTYCSVARKRVLSRTRLVQCFYTAIHPLSCDLVCILRENFTPVKVHSSPNAELGLYSKFQACTVCCLQVVSLHEYGSSAAFFISPISRLQVHFGHDLPQTTGGPYNHPLWF